MPRVQLQLYVDPGSAEIVCNLLLNDGTYERMTAVVDTGAEVSMFPRELLQRVKYRLGSREKITVEQAGIAKQSFEAVEGFVSLYFEDQLGNETGLIEVPVWFAEGTIPLVGFSGILDRVVLHIDMIQRVGWIEVEDEEN
jgi:hypothetical protein